MKNMNNFAAQQLSKSQMNSVKGGAYCVAYDKDGNPIASANYPGQHVAGATVAMEIALIRDGFEQGSYEVICH
ncbi:MAG: hypothetical protein IKV77_00250 [Alistipes sp.]|nr:hypothetical protein [Alistipes sp.]